MEDWAVPLASAAYAALLLAVGVLWKRCNTLADANTQLLIDKLTADKEQAVIDTAATGAFQVLTGEVRSLKAAVYAMQSNQQGGAA